MAREGAIIFSDLIAKLDMLRVECPKCGRSGRYRLADLITRYGRDEKLFAFTDDVTATCERRRARSDGDQCGAIWPTIEGTGSTLSLLGASRYCASIKRGSRSPISRHMAPGTR
jgi:hypothetical protein